MSRILGGMGSIVANRGIETRRLKVDSFCPSFTSVFQDRYQTTRGDVLKRSKFGDESLMCNKDCEWPERALKMIEIACERRMF